MKIFQYQYVYLLYHRPKLNRSTPLSEKSVHMKVVPLSPICDKPLSDESIVGEKEQDDSLDWCTLSKEVASSKERRARNVRTSPRKRNLTVTEKRKKVLPVKSVSPRVVKVTNRTRQNAESESKHNTSDDEMVINSSAPRNVVSEAASNVVRPSINEGGTQKDTTAAHKEKNNSTLKEAKNTVTEVPKKIITRQSNIPVEIISNSPVGSKKLNCVKGDESSAVENSWNANGASESVNGISGNTERLGNKSKVAVVCENVTIDHEMEKENAGSNNSSSSRRSLLKKTQDTVALDLNEEPVVTTEGIEKTQKSAEELHEVVTSSVITGGCENSQSVPSRKRGRSRKNTNSQIQEPEPASSETSEENAPDPKPTAVLAKKKESRISQETNSKKNQRRSLKRLSSKDADSSPRKSKRQRVAPLQFWKGERLQYEPISHPECLTICKIVGVVRPRVEAKIVKKDAAAPNNKLKQKKTHKKINGQNKEDYLSLSRTISEAGNPMEKITMKLDKTTDVVCATHFSKNAFEPFVLNSGQRIDGFMFHPGLSLNNLANGFLNIAAGASHDEEVNDDVELLLVVIKGRVDITVNDHLVHARPGSSVSVPRGIPYKIENTSPSDSLLSYVTIFFS
ncbi:uncharacterized protein LOC134534559 isoform X2 [Bacillus rossius redtenbacheri]|uniref:uncharacterized protein LOC134534559 isoform X2 n=1 Tax=Bacillus rossius redtenbacheri TaxID=93214 RepID=UPI002FDC97ED